MKIIPVNRMREDVLIILNEREPLKKEVAAELLHRLEKANVCCERLDPCENLAHVIIERCPKLLVLDYLLGDVATALDVLAYFGDHDCLDVPKTVIWTDETSAHVAVEAMKLGAADYIEIGSPRSLERVLSFIDSSLGPLHSESMRSNHSLSPRKKDALIAQSECFRSCLSLAQLFAKQQSQIVVLLGKCGCGRNSVAKYIHAHRKQAGHLIELDFDTWDGEIQSICTSSSRDYSLPLLSNASTVMIDHVDSDTGELLEFVSSHINTDSSCRDQEDSSMLIVGILEEALAKAWIRLAKAEIIEIPSLSERPEDLLPLVQKFAQIAVGTNETKTLNLSREILEALQTMDWPGNVRQLHSSVIEATIDSQLDVERELSSAIPVNSTKNAFSKDQKRFLQAIVRAKKRWEKYYSSVPFFPDPVIARNALDNAEGNWRIAAARLGTGVLQLRAVLNIKKKDSSHPGSQLSKDDIGDTEHDR